MATMVSIDVRSDTELKARLTALIQANCSKEAIQGELGVSRDELRRMFGELDEALRRQWRAHRRAEVCPRKFTPDDKIAALREAASLTRGRISIKEYDQLRATHPHWPSSSSLRREEGWNWWKRRAKLQPFPPPTISDQLYSDDQCRKAAGRVSELLGGRTFSLAEYDRLRRPGDPTGCCLRDRSGPGRWVPALKALLPDLFLDHPR